jgi:hypothetical protein
MCRPRVAYSLLLAVVGGLACGERRRVEPDSVVNTTSATTITDRPADWVSELGPVLVVPSDTEQTGVVLFPATPSQQLIEAAPLTLLSPAGELTRTTASLVVSDSQVCGEAPTIRIGGEATAAWSVGLRARAAVPLKMDSIEALTSSDSARLVAALARLASAVPTVRASRFSGLPFVVLSARRFNVAGTHTVLAHLMRRLPQEASPLQEHSFVVGERSATSAGDAYALTYHQRSEGTEETADHYDVLTAARAGANTFLVLSREQDARTVYEILERGNTGWRSRWQRTLAC